MPLFFYILSSFRKLKKFSEIGHRNFIKTFLQLWSKKAIIKENKFSIKQLTKKS